MVVTVGAEYVPHSFHSFLTQNRPIRPAPVLPAADIHPTCNCFPVIDTSLVLASRMLEGVFCFLWFYFAPPPSPRHVLILPIVIQCQICITSACSHKYMYIYIYIFIRALSGIFFAYNLNFVFTIRRAWRVCMDCVTTPLHVWLTYPGDWRLFLSEIEASS